MVCLLGVDMFRWFFYRSIYSALHCEYGPLSVRFQKCFFAMIFVAIVGWDGTIPLDQGPASFHGEATEEWSDEQQAGAEMP